MFHNITRNRTDKIRRHSITHPNVRMHTLFTLERFFYSVFFRLITTTETHAEKKREKICLVFLSRLDN